MTASIYRAGYALLEVLEKSPRSGDDALEAELDAVATKLREELDAAYAPDAIAEDERNAIEEHADGVHEGQTPTTGPQPDRCAICAMPEAERAAMIARVEAGEV